MSGWRRPPNGTVTISTARCSFWLAIRPESPLFHFSEIMTTPPVGRPALTRDRTVYPYRFPPFPISDVLCSFGHTGGRQILARHRRCSHHLGTGKAWGGTIWKSVSKFQTKCCAAVVKGFEGFLSQVLNALAAMPLLSEFCQGDESSRLLWDFPEMFNLLIYILYELPTYLSSYTILYHPLFEMLQCSFTIWKVFFASPFSMSGRILFDLSVLQGSRCVSSRPQSESGNPRDKGHRTSLQSGWRLQHLRISLYMVWNDLVQSKTRF